jgi:type IV fimbrial biogenesis protein FimT
MVIKENSIGSIVLIMNIEPKTSSLARGFTMIELLVVIALIAVLASLAAPALSTFVSRSTVRGLSTDFALGMQRARLEAINRNMCVSMCMSSSAGSGSPKCLASGDEWGVGWIVFLNPTCDTSLTASNPDASNNEAVVLVRDTSGARFSIQNGNSGTRSVMFNSRGVPLLANTGAFNISDTSVSSSSPDDKYNRTICLDAVGRVRTVVSLASCS